MHSILNNARSNTAFSNTARYCIVVLMMLVAAGCSSRTLVSERSTAPSSSGGGFYGGDLPPSTIPDNIDLVAEAIPVALPRSKTGNKPYKALGKSYRPLATAEGYRATGIASWYGKKFHGRRTSSGEAYDMFAMTAAHTILPLPSFVRVTNLANSRSVVVKVNDRGPFLHNRLIDLSYAAAHRIGITKSGTGKVEVVALSAQEQKKQEQQTASQVITGVANVQPQSSQKYALQLGVFSLADNAIGLRNWLRQKGYPLEPATDAQLLAAGPPFRVQSGPFPSVEAAESMRQKLQALTRDKVLLKTL